MESNDAAVYYIWGADLASYGPAELPQIVAWIKEERILADTWIFSHEGAAWAKAAEVPELKMFFKPISVPLPGSGSSGPDANPVVKPGALRRIKIFADIEHEHLEAFAQFMELEKVGPGVHVVRKGEPSGAMYFVLEGELRSCLIVDGVETPLSTLTPGNLFGEISLLDHGAHTMDVIANQPSVLLKLSAGNFTKAVRQIPHAVVPFLMNLSRAIASRVRLLTKKYEDCVHVSLTAD